MKSVTKFLFIAFFVLLIISFCSDSGTSPDKVNYIIPDKDVSYYNDLQPMFNGKCGFGSACHSENVETIIPFKTKEDFMNHVIPLTGEKLVEMPLHRLSPKSSPLYLIVTESHGGYERMPPATYNREPLTQNQINGIVTWLKEGAND